MSHLGNRPQISMKRIFILALSFYVLILIQTSFLVHFSIFSGKFRESILILVTIVLINLFESETKFLGIFSGILGGLFLDIFSSFILGTTILTFILIFYYLYFPLYFIIYLLMFFKVGKGGAEERKRETLK